MKLSKTKEKQTKKKEKQKQKNWSGTQKGKKLKTDWAVYKMAKQKNPNDWLMPG